MITIPWRQRRSAPLSALLLSLIGSLLSGGCAQTSSHREDRVPVSSAVAATEILVEKSAVEGASAELNENFESVDLNVTEFVGRFEGESREIYSQREEIVAALALQPGESVADIGSGTGFFSILFGLEVGKQGRVFGVDISPKFIGYLYERAYALNLGQVKTVLCTDKSTKLKKASIDVAFICDTYHHFEFPAETMASLRSALRPGGRLMIVDFKRIPGVTRPWMLNHVRCGKEQVIAEVEAAGFVRREAPRVPGLTENYVLLFERP